MKMRKSGEKGISMVEFAFVVLSMVPLIIGIGVIGVNLVRALQTEQVARDAGHMFARNVDFSASGNQQILANIGSNLNLSATAGSGSAVVILSALTYVDQAACAAGNAVDSKGNPSGCTNLGKWVITRRLTIGNSSVRSSAIGSLTGVPINSTTGVIAASDYVTNSGAVTTFNSISAYSNVGGKVSGMPSGQIVFVSEAAAREYTLAPYAGGATYALGVF